MLVSIIFAISVLILFIEYMMYPKSKKPQNFMCHMWMGIMVLFGFICFSGAVIQLVHLSVNLRNMAVINYVTAAFLAFVILKKKRVQRYYVRLYDVLGTVLIIGFTAVFALMRYKAGLSQFFYKTSDSAVHYQYALDIVRSGSLVTLFYTHLIDALMILFVSPFMAMTEWYRVFILGSLIFYALSGGVLFTLFCEHAKTRFAKGLSILATLGYMAGYQMSNIMYGYEYLGAGITVAAFIIWLLERYQENETDRVFLVVLVMFANTSMCLSYVMFAPMVFAAEFIFLMIVLIKEKRLFRLGSIVSGIAGFLIPGLLVIYYLLVVFFPNTAKTAETVTSAIGMDGNIYRDMFSNFVVLGVFAILFIKQCIRKRRNDIGFWMLVASVTFTVLSFVGMYYKRVSTYYFYKNHYFMWLVFIYAAVKFIMANEKRYREMVTVIAAVMAALLVVAVTGAEYKLYEKNPWMCLTQKADDYLDIFVSNYVELVNDVSDVTAPAMELYKMAGKIAHDTGQVVPFLGSDDNVWRKYYYTLTVQSPSEEIDKINDDPEDMEGKIEGYQYAIVATDDTANVYEEYREFLQEQEVVYQNEYGMIVRFAD